jgi:hypothetical protein
MNRYRHLFQPQGSTWLDFIALGFMSLAAPWIAAGIHSVCVFRSGIRFYNAEIWRLYEQPDFLGVLVWIGGFSVPGLVTFLILLPFRKLMLLRWIIWTCCILLWVGAFFKMEIAFN